MYKLMKFLSILIRQFCLPNPFENLPNGIIINWIAEPILHAITFGVVGLFYRERSAPALGSFLYLVFYFIHTGLLMICSYFNFANIAIIIITSLYILALSGLSILFRKLRGDLYL